MQSRIMRMANDYLVNQLHPNPKAYGTDVKGKRPLARYKVAQGKGAMAWALRQGPTATETMSPDIYRETLARCLGSHDRDGPIVSG